MAYVTQEITSFKALSSPAHLWLGPSDSALKRVITCLQNSVCKNGGCKTCTQCRMVTEQQHQSIMWFYPEKQYTRDQFAPLFEQLSFQLNDGEQYFFVIEKGDFLSPAVANSLLKSLEEPPPGYYFLLLAERINLVIPTIRSRCIIHRIASDGSSLRQHPLFDFFSSSTFHDPTVFLKTVDHSGITERESVELLDTIFSYWANEHRSALLANNTTHINQSRHALNALSQAYEHLPMPGSSKLFWKDLYLQLRE